VQSAEETALFSGRPLGVEVVTAGQGPVLDRRPRGDRFCQLALALVEEGGGVQGTDVLGVEVECVAPVRQRAGTIARGGPNVSSTLDQDPVLVGQGHAGIDHPASLVVPAGGQMRPGQVAVLANVTRCGGELGAVVADLLVDLTQRGPRRDLLVQDLVRLGVEGQSTLVLLDRSP
jgi:hypothetical protein